jgi:hypothetical protein
MEKIPFSYKISKDIAELFDSLYARLGDPKYKIVEAAIEVFAALPKEAQYVLKSQDDNDRKIVLEHLRKLNLKSTKGKTA